MICNYNKSVIITKYNNPVIKYANVIVLWHSVIVSYYINNIYIKQVFLCYALQCLTGKVDNNKVCTVYHMARDNVDKTPSKLLKVRYVSPILTASTLNVHPVTSPYQ